MFGKLKEKLKETLSIFSRKAKEEAEEKALPQAVPEEERRAPSKEKVTKERAWKEEKNEKKKELKEGTKKDSQKGPQRAQKQPLPETKKEVETEQPVPLRATEEQKLSQKKEIPEKRFAETKEAKEEKLVEKEAREEAIPEEQEAPKRSFFQKLTEKLTTKTISAEKFSELFWDLELALLENNVAVAIIERLKEDLSRELVDKPLPRDVEQKILETLRESLHDILSFEAQPLEKLIAQKKPFVIALFGINGSGKTTTAAKLAHRLQQQGFSVVLAACDTFRAAAIQQLEEHAQRLKVKLIKHTYGADAAAVAFDAVKYAEKNKMDVVLLDTAGRLHSNVNLMAELEKIIRVAKPDLKLFVGESITGNDCVEQAQQFHHHLQLDGVILTKADVDEKGGAPLSIAYTVKRPIFFLGMGQKYEDLQPFDREKVLEQLGLG